MPGASSRLQIQIDAKNNSSAAIKGVTNDLKGLDNAASSIAGGLGGLAGAAGVAGLVALAVAAGGAGVEMAKGAAQAERLGTAFDTLAGQAGESGDAMLAAMQEASRGTISNSELMLSANRAMMLGVADSAEEMAQLLDVAGARGKAMGLSTAEAFSDLVTGIGRMSPLILDNLGITVDADKANQAYAVSIGKTAEQLTEAERKQALLNAVIQSSTDLINENKDAGDDAASNYERMDAALTNAKDALGQLFSPAIAAIAQDLALAVVEVTDAITSDKIEKASASTAGLWQELQRLTQEYQAAEIASTMALIRPEMAAKAEQDLKNVVAQLHSFGVAYNHAAAIAGLPLLDLAALERGIMAFDETAASLNQLAAAAPGAAAGLEQVSQAARAAARGIQEAGLMADLAQEQFNALMAQSAGVSAAIEQAASAAGVLFGSKQGGDAGLRRQEEVTEELTAQRRLWREMGYEEKEIADVLMPAYVQQLQEADRAVFSTAKGTTKISDAAREANREFSALEGAVSSILSGALDPGVGVDPDKMLEAMGFPREDAINENARRLADIAANGLKGQDWLGAFGDEVPDIWRMIRTAQNPQEEAARLLKDFQDGLLTAPIDKEKVKEIVRRQIMGDQNMGALANEIARELATEMGIPLQEALAATQGAMGTGTGAGSAAATAFSDAAASGLEQEDGGGAFVDKFTEQMRARYSLLMTAGRDAGKEWGAGFLAVVGDSVPPGLISLLVNLVTPGVMQAFAQKGSLEGAPP